MASWSTGGQALWSAPSAPEITYTTANFSDNGQVIGGTTAAATSTYPATWGRVIANPTAVADQWVKISGTAARAGDAVYLVYEGRRTSLPTNPAARITGAAGPGAPGINVINDGEVELSLSGVNTDLNYVHWFLMRTPV